jgi:hypothetical protein
MSRDIGKFFKVLFSDGYDKKMVMINNRAVNTQCITRKQ